MRKNILFIFVSIVSGVLLLSPGAALSVETSQLEVRLTDHRPGIADFKQLYVSLSAISLHTKGAARSQGWLDLVTDTKAIDIVPLKQGRYQSLAKLSVPGARFDALRVRFAKLEGFLLSGKTTLLKSRDTTVRIKLDTRSKEHSILVVDLYAESQIDHTPKRYVVKVKEVRIDG